MCLFCPLSALADGATTITVDSKTAVPTDTVNIGIEIADNRGIMAMTFSINYDSSVLSFSGFGKGYLTDYTVFDDKINSKINFVNCEDTDIAQDGKIVILQFTVNENAPKGFSPITISHINPETQGDSLEGCFARSDFTSVIPDVVNGGVTVGTPCIDSPHKFSDFYFELEPTCTKQGLKSRSCSVCGHTESEIALAFGHDFEQFWTVDREAKGGVSGVLSRHCKMCEAKTDILTFDGTDAENGGITNKEQSKISADILNRLEKFAAMLKGTLQNDEEPPSDSDEPFFTEPQLPQTEIKNAQELVDSRGRINMSLMLKRIYEYLFGSEEKQGIFEVIKDAFAIELPNEKWNPLILILLILII